MTNFNQLQETSDQKSDKMLTDDKWVHAERQEAEDEEKVEEEQDVHEEDVHEEDVHEEDGDEEDGDEFPVLDENIYQNFPLVCLLMLG